MTDSQTTVLAPVEPDWNEVQRRYLTGESPSEIAADLGLNAKEISQRAWRQHWKAQQFKLLGQSKKEVAEEVLGCITVSVLREARVWQREETPSDLEERDVANRTRLRLLETASKLFGWDADPLERMKSAKALDV